jgi:hypothetical protein
LTDLARDHVEAPLHAESGRIVEAVLAAGPSSRPTRRSRAERHRQLARRARRSA